MNNLYRKLAPISDAAWEEIEEEATRTLKRYLGARCIVDVKGPLGTAFSAVGTGHINEIESPGEDVQAAKREVKSVVEFKIPFALSRQAIDDVARGSEDSDWGPLQEAARKIAYAEDQTVFDGYKAGSIEGIRQGSTHPTYKLPANVKKYPEVIAKAVNELRLAGVNGPYALVLGNEAYTKATGGSDEGFPLLSHIEHLIDDKIVWSPAIEGGAVVSLRGGDFQFNLGQDISIGYDHHTADTVTLYFIESFNFRLLTPEAVVHLAQHKTK